ncbi:MAG: DsbA family protein [Dehalococcoidia bacterium]
MGRQDAPLKLVIYEDFQCPFCLFYNAFVEPSLVASWVDTNQLQIEFRHFIVLGNESAAAAIASQCAADQEAFWEYHRALFLAQARAGQLSGEQINVGRFSVEELKRHAADLGLDAGRFDACLDDQASLELLAQQEQTAHGLGVTGTPTFFLNEQVVRPAPSTVEEWNLLLLEAIGELTGD